MFRARTVFVIGAGASYEVGLPIGDDLLKTIVGMTHFSFEHFGRQTSGDHVIVEALRAILVEHNGRNDNLNEHLRMGRQLGKSAQQALSIDNLIDALENPQVELLGKLGIVRAILKAEAESPQFQVNQETRSIDLSRFAKTWYVHLTKLLTEQVKRSEISKLFDNLEIIIFNYDRCLEHYLPFSLSDYYGVTPDEIREAMQGLTIHRPYGLTGRLPWRKGDGPAVDFGASGAKQLADVVSQIRTFTEQMEEGDQLDAMRAAISGAERIVFLGFAFHRQNVELITADIGDDTTILATALGISRSDQAVIADELAQAFGFAGDKLAGRRIDLTEATCAELFQTYRRTLTAAPPEF